MGILKSLTLLRHAKSGWDDPVARDFDRPLNGKGKRAAAMMGRHMRSLGLTFDHVVASPAVRVMETLDEIERGYGKALHAAWDRRLYLASAETLLDVVQELPDALGDVLVVGHNPGLEDLVLMLVPDVAGNPFRDAVEEKYPTASVARLSFAVEDWPAVKPGGAVFERFVRPRDLDPELGPDQV